MTRAGSRHDGDTWDVASGVGATAAAVATSRALASHAGMIDDPFAEPLVRAVGMDVFVGMLHGELDSDDPESDLQRMTLGMAVRTRYFDDFLLDATAAGIRQAVILASGLDARSHRLPWPAGTVVYEIDQPQVIDFKATTLDELGAGPTATLRRARGSPKACWCISRRTPRTGCSTTSPP
jgi:methyltransferase (TIGR00027 family)